MSEQNTASELSHQNNSKSTKFPFKQITISAVLLAGVLFLLQMEGVKSFAGEFLQLTPADLLFIPISAFIFLVFWRLMELKVLLPFMQLHEAREEATTGSLDEAEALTAKAQEIEEEAEETLLAARREALAKKIEIISEGKTEAGQILTQAENESSELIQAAGRQAEASSKELEQQLAGKSTELVDQLVDKLKQTPGVK